MSNVPPLPLGVIGWPYEVPGVITEPGGGGSFTDTITFYAAATSGGTVNVLNTVTIVDGLITNWTQAGPSGTPGEWQFNDAVNSGQYLTIGF
jgi:hypothetical protein